MPIDTNPMVLDGQMVDTVLSQGNKSRYWLALQLGMDERGLGELLAGKRVITGVVPKIAGLLEVPVTAVSR